jgi:HK97 gp10 family phage protein
MINIKMNRLIKFNTMEKQLQNAVEETIGECAQIALQEARRNAPVGIGFSHAGKLRDSINVESDNTGFTLYTDGSTLNRSEQDYANYNEYGSIYTPAGTIDSPIRTRSGGYRPFMRPAVLKARDSASNVFGKKWYGKSGRP